MASLIDKKLVIDTDQELKDLLISGRPLIDVRAPIEFRQGAIDGAVNLPILNDEERALVGTLYKQQGQEAAIQLGHQLVSGQKKEERLRAWVSEIEKSDSVIYCFRGGLRSKTTQAWLKEFADLDVSLIRGGYKRVRNYYLETLEKAKSGGPFQVISGPTGSGKTELLRHLQSHKPVLDLEFLAKHRGSAFGAYDEVQPSQAFFENLVASQLLRLETRISSQGLWLEDESRMIGQVHQPISIFEKIRESDVVWIDDPVDIRGLRILREYVETPLKKHPPDFVFRRLLKAIQAISKKLGSEKAKQMSDHIQLCQIDWVSRGDLSKNSDWIEELLRSYYDPLYLRSLDRRQVKVAFKGSFADCLSYALNK